jgi:Diacylglycerol kinase catalytic domain
MPRHRRVAAALALALMAASVAGAAALAIRNFPRGLVVLALVAAAVWIGLYAITHRGARRAVTLTVAGLLVGVTFVLLVRRDPAVLAAVAVAAIGAVVAARIAFHGRAELPRAARPERPVLFYNPRSGGGKAARFHLADEAHARGIKAVELTPGTDLEVLVRAELEAGADALAMAGGDGSQAIVAAIAAEHRLPYACIPAGTRNHFALDLGVDRDDVAGALDAFVDGGERIVDLADVGGRVFVNNVSLGVYASAVQRSEYRDAKLRTLFDTLPDAAGGNGEGQRLTWHGPDGAEHDSGVVMLVSNNRYRVGRAIGSGTRPRLDAGVLGVAVFGGDGGRGRKEWSTSDFDVDAADAELVAAGIDGEAAQLAPPLRFHIHPNALRVRVARSHPGASPSALIPDGAWPAVQALGRIAAGRS